MHLSHLGNRTQMLQLVETGLISGSTSLCDTDSHTLADHFFLNFSSLRYCVPDFLGGSVLRALLHHDDAQYGWRQRLPLSAGRDLLLLALFCGLDCASAAGLEQIRAWGSRDHVLGGLEDADTEQYILHYLPVHLLPGPALQRYRLLLWQASARHQTGAILQM